MIEKSVRGLARRYAAGEVSRDEYRRQRTELIRSIVQGTAPVVPYQPAEQDGTTTTQTVTRPRPATANAGETPAEAPPPSPYLLPAIIAVLLAIIGIGVALWWPEESPEQPRVEAQPPPAERPFPAAGQELIAAFLMAGDWQPGALDGFRRQWDGLAAEERAAALETTEYVRLGDAIAERLGAPSQADAAPGDSPATLEPLREFAAALGFGPAAAPEAVDATGPEATVPLAALETPADLAPPGPAVADEPATADAPGGEASAPPANPDTAVGPADTGGHTTPATDAELAAAAADAEAPDQGAAAPEPVAEAEAPAEAEPAPPAASAPAPAEAAAEAAAEPAPEKPSDAPATAEGEGRTPTAPASPRTAADAAGAQPAAAPTKPRGCHAGLAGSRRPYCHDRLSNNAPGPTMVVLNGGEFTMGGDKPEEQPRRSVRIGYAFAISVNEISAGEFAAFCEATGRTCPAQPWGADDFPVVGVNWQDALEYTRWLSQETGRTYRLPSEAEWEYSARAGSTTKYPFGDELLPSHARFTYTTTPDAPLPKSDRSINRNKFRLYHMLGNVREWVGDAWASGYEGAPGDGSPRTAASAAERVVRGGSYRDGADALRSAARAHLPENAADALTGFRVVQPLAGADAADATALEDHRWLAGQREADLTLQLFAVQSLEKVKELLAAHPQLDVKILPANGGNVRYRIVYGVFQSTREAENAFASLPPAITAQSGRPIVKTIADLRAQTTH
jgi:formylglycine-generating enzyme required for sulfatase activity